ncbi:MAG: NifU family protein [Patescibacteria group bacterium]|jgi:Fe-S cluster biogenesis protein NfuA
MREKIQKALDKIRPMLQSDGGDVHFAGFDEKTGTLKLELQGMCSHCPMAHITLKEGIEKQIKEEIPEVKKVIAI